MKPRLLPDVRFLPSEAGLSVRAPGHEATVLHAPGLYPWFERVCPFLDGEHSVVDLVEKLSPMAAQRVLGLVEFLLREGFARDAQYDVPHTLSHSTRSLHAAVIEFLAREADSPERRFQSYRECAPVVVGSGRLLTATGSGCGIDAPCAPAVGGAAPRPPTCCPRWPCWSAIWSSPTTASLDRE